MSGRPRAGFSLVEALVTLAVTSLLLTLLFSVGAGARGAGFRTSRRSLEAADTQVGAASLRLLLRGVRLPERGKSDVPFLGEADRLTAAVSPARATACPGVRAGASMQLRLERSGGRTRLVCAGEGGPATPLLDLGAGPAAFAYALAGRPWTDRLEARAPPAPSTGTRSPAAPPPRLWIRLAGPGLEVIEAVERPPPRPTPPGAPAPSGPTPSGGAGA